MTCYAVIDTNVLVSALLSKHNDAATVQIVARFIAGDIIPVYNEAIIQEYQEVLLRKKFKFNPSLIKALISAIKKYGLSADSSPTGVILPDMKDLPFYEITIATRNQHSYLITGNLKHFPTEPFIVTARQMLDILHSQK